MSARRGPDPRVAVVVITHNRRDEVLGVLERMTRVPERPQIVVVDNASRDGTATAVAERHPEVEVIRARANLGAVARNIGVAAVTAPYVAFCDDDTWWEAGALSQAADLLDAHPDVASLTGRILVEPGSREDPITPELRDSPVPAPDSLPGPALLSILAGASVLRVSAFDQVGGFSPRLWLGGEEELLALDLARAGWWMCWIEDLVVHHAPSHSRDPRRRRQLGIRNTLWTAWLRRPASGALRRTVAVLRSIPPDAASLAALAEAAAGLPWVLRERAPVPPRVEQGLRLLEEPQRTSRARRYVG
ncbi:glycosyltransferase family 2 protein [Marinactinospora thermotolerans]|uniref:Glycosyltransferase, GT2 family n=1 Tax=Marinactinospora thermotolerans DSM 45154 TaxID=1122192 RepID=A0A1T4K4W1_9ACTN|nr:glycosyltransferase [Marinactinospora thermotolerans]SJZ37367.1 Glycosyltransferase, GT2 family [Marinactinospora thermotolerans DSM 45154]